MRIFHLFVVFMILPVLLFGQLKKDLQQPKISNILTNPQMTSPFYSLLDPSKLHMQHSFSMSYMSMGGAGVMLNSYINTINYQFNDKLSLTTNIGLMGSPYNTLPANSPLNENQIFGGAKLMYQPSDKTFISLEFQSLPYINNHYYYNRTPWFNRSDF